MAHALAALSLLYLTVIRKPIGVGYESFLKSDVFCFVLFIRWLKHGTDCLAATECKDFSEMPGKRKEPVS